MFRAYHKAIAVLSALLLAAGTLCWFCLALTQTANPASKVGVQVTGGASAAVQVTVVKQPASALWDRERAESWLSGTFHRPLHPHYQLDDLAEASGIGTSCSFRWFHNRTCDLTIVLTENGRSITQSARVDFPAPDQEPQVVLAGGAAIPVSRALAQGGQWGFSPDDAMRQLLADLLDLRRMQSADVVPPPPGTFRVPGSWCVNELYVDDNGVVIDEFWRRRGYRLIMELKQADYSPTDSKRMLGCVFQDWYGRTVPDLTQKYRLLEGKDYSYIILADAIFPPGCEVSELRSYFKGAPGTHESNARTYLVERLRVRIDQQVGMQVVHGTARFPDPPFRNQWPRDYDIEGPQ